MSKLPDGLRDGCNRKLQDIRRSYGREPCVSYFSGFANEEQFRPMNKYFIEKQCKSMLRIQRKSLIRIRK